MIVAVVAPILASGERGGAEILFDEMVGGLNRCGARAEKVEVVSDESDFEALETTLRRFRALDLSRFDGVVSTKAPSFLVEHPNHVCYLQHTLRSFYDRFDDEFPSPSRSALRLRKLIHRLDRAALSPPRVKKVFAQAREVSLRLAKWNGLEVEVLHPGLPPGPYACRGAEYLFLPSRLHRWKRIGLLLEAMRFVRADIKLKIAGLGEEAARLRALAGTDDRIDFLGEVSRERLLGLYADALAVPFVPAGEDFGFVTVEAFASAKPVITCRDSGEPARLVRDGRTGFVCRPRPEEIAERIDRLAADRSEAAAMGARARTAIALPTWEELGRRLLAELERAR
jgi:glycosyltransferase involved in cell wall biosynthesis